MGPKIKGKKINTDSVAWTSCDLLARGLPEVASLRLDRDIKKGEKMPHKKKYIKLKRILIF